MHQRIKLLNSLLDKNGVFCMQCDYNEGIFKNCLWEIFGRNQLYYNVTVKTSSESGVKVNANKPAKISEYILIYGKNKELVEYKTIRIVTGYDKNYSYYIKNPNDDCSKWEFGKHQRCFV